MSSLEVVSQPAPSSLEPEEKSEKLAVSVQRDSAECKNATHATKEAELGAKDAERAAFLATFSLEEERRILRKIDYRFLLLLGIMHMA